MSTDVPGLLRGACEEADSVGKLEEVLSLQLEVLVDEEGRVHLHSWRGGTVCTAGVSGTAAAEERTVADLTDEALDVDGEELCPECLSGEAINAKDAEAATATNVLLLLLALHRHKRDRGRLDAAARRGEATLRDVVEVDQDAQWIVAGAEHARRRSGNEWEETLQSVEYAAKETYPITRRAGATKRARREAVNRIPTKKKPKGTGAHEAETGAARLLVWNGTRRDLRLALSPLDLQVVLTHLAHEGDGLTVVRASGKALTHLKERARTGPDHEAALPDEVGEAEIETALKLWDEGDGPLGTLEGALEAARNVHA